MKRGVVETERLSDFSEEFGLLTSGRVRPTRFPSWHPEMADNRHRAKLPDNQANVALSGQKGKIINGWTDPHRRGM
jgi:hypothetical protein